MKFMPLNLANKKLLCNSCDTILVRAPTHVCHLSHSNVLPRVSDPELFHDFSR
jgi:hypothetical protein